MKGKQNMKKNIFIVLLLVFIIALTSCTKTTNQENTTSTPEQEIQEETNEDANDANVVHLTDEIYHETVDNSEGVVIVDFWADWCPPCVKLGPILEEISMEENITLYKVDVDECPETAKEFKIASIPMVYIYKDGEVVDSQMGLADKKFYLDMINQYR